MTAYGPPPAAPRSAANPEQRARLLAMVAGGLGVLSFIWGFLNWFTEGSGSNKTTYGGYAFISNSPAAIGFSIAAGLLALAYVYEKRALSVVPLALAATSLLLLIGLLIGKGNASSDGNSPDVGADVGLILAFITVLLQVAALAVGWLDATGRMKQSSRGTATSAWTGGSAGAAGTPGPAAYGAQPQGQFGAPTAYGSPQGDYRQQQAYAPPAPQGYPGQQPGAMPATGEPTQALPTPGSVPPSQPGQPGQPVQPSQYPPPPQGEYQPQHPQ